MSFEGQKPEIATTGKNSSVTRDFCWESLAFGVALNLVIFSTVFGFYNSRAFVFGGSNP